jgi:predicted nucleic acid-binding protein
VILYCDSSALVKLYVVEPGSEEVRAAVEAAEAVATCRITWAEIHAALSRRAREAPQDAAAIETAKQAFAAEWLHYVVIEVSQSIVERAGEFADTFALRGYDAVQLAAAQLLAEASGEACAFACFDLRLAKAAKVLGLGTHAGKTGG